MLKLDLEHGKIFMGHLLITKTTLLLEQQTQLTGTDILV
jgi:hypothetical protein